MITFELFEEFITSYQNFDKGIRRFEEAIFGKKYTQIWECDWCLSVEKMLDSFIDSHFTDKGGNWILYYLFEDIEDKIVTITVEGDIFRDPGIVEFHLNSIKELWDFLCTDKELYFKHE